MSLKAILIDDEKLALDFLEHQINRISSIEVVGKFSNPWKAFDYIDEKNVEVVFLDIHIPEINGIELAEKILERNPRLHIVFVTGHDDYAIQAFELNALDYVMKPVSAKRLSNTIERITEKVAYDTLSQKKPLAKQLKMTLFQRVAILDSNNQLRSPNWRTSKVEQLFYYLLHRRGQVVDKTELIELLWPDFDLKKAFSQLYTSIYHIRKTIEDYDGHFLLSNTSIGYMLTLEDVSLDVEEFENIVRKDQAISKDTIEEFEYAISLYKGDYLQGYDYFWIESERQRLEQLWMRTVYWILNYYYTQKQSDKIIELATEIIQRFPLEEKAYLFLMKAYARRNQKVMVEQTYAQITELLQKELQEEPQPEITCWYEDWKKKNKEWST
ncbi:response regulator [Gracilibacillus halotolerans]